MNLNKNRITLGVAVVAAVVLFMYIKPNKSESYKSCGCGA